MHRQTKLCSLCLLLVACDVEDDDFVDDQELIDARLLSGGVETTHRLNTANFSYLPQLPPACASQLSTYKGEISETAVSCYGEFFYTFGGEWGWFDDEGVEVPGYGHLVFETYIDGQHWNDFFYNCPGAQLFAHKGMRVFSNGIVQGDQSRLYLGCTDSAAGKAANWGFAPWDDLDRFEGGIRVVRADYCGNNTPKTTDGVLIGLQTYRPTANKSTANKVYENKSASQDKLEAVWDENGAICVDNPRHTTIGNLGCNGIPSCDDLGGLEHLLATRKPDIIAVTWVD